MEQQRALSIGLVGARGYVGRELVALIARHPIFRLRFVASTTAAGQRVADQLPGAPPWMIFEDLSPEAVAEKGADAVVLALSNDQSKPYVEALDRLRPETVIVDVSADHRFDEGWVWGLPEIIHPGALPGATRIANPGCYATAMALGLSPLRRMLAAPAHAFGVSGYSGAGATPSPRNDVEALRDNLMPYQLIGHVHEKEVSRHVARVRFVPHVAPFFRGITMTISMLLKRPIEARELEAVYRACYPDEPFVRVTQEIPHVRDAANQPHATIGGFAADRDEHRVVVIVTLDNLLKGAASQALQNLNLSFGLPQAAGILG